MHIKINEINSLDEPKSYSVIPDDRQQIIATDGGNVVQDFGHVSSGDQISCAEVRFSKTDFETIYGYWQNREPVTFTDCNGTVWQDVRVKIDKYSFVSRFPDYITCDLTIWMI